MADEGAPPRLVERAEERLAALEAPLPPLEVSGELPLNLGQRGPEAEPFHPGDPLFPSFELSTPGDQLPALVDVTISLLPQDAEEGAEPLAVTTAAVETPPGAVGYVVDFMDLELPADLPAGEYSLQVEATSGEELSASAGTEFSVSGDVVPLRQLFARNVIMTGLEIEAPLYGRADMGTVERVVERMVQELRDLTTLFTFERTASLADLLAAAPVVRPRWPPFRPPRTRTRRSSRSIRLCSVRRL